MEEKYFIIDNAKQYFIIIKCTKQKLNYCLEYGIKNSLTNENAINLYKMSEWLINHQIRHGIVYGKTNNIILRVFIKFDIRKLEIKARKNNLLIENEELEKLLDINEDERLKLFW